MASSHYSFRYRRDDDDCSYMTTRSSSTRSSYYNPTRLLPNRNHEVAQDEDNNSYNLNHYNVTAGRSRSFTPLPSSSSYYQNGITDLSYEDDNDQFVDLTDYHGLVEDNDNGFLLQDRRYTHPALQSQHEKCFDFDTDAQSEDGRVRFEQGRSSYDRAL